MTRNKPYNKPTEAELSLLNVLWEIGPASVREIHDFVSKSQTTGYTTVLKILQIMHEKEFVIRDESKRAHIYATANSQIHTQSSLLTDLIAKAFGGSKSNLVMQAIDESTTQAEINDIRELLNKIENTEA